MIEMLRKKDYFSCFSNDLVSKIPLTYRSELIIDMGWAYGVASLVAPIYTVDPYIYRPNAAPPRDIW